ncbi:hypothetical protein SERLADRAFT_444458 [Serpula lacrymans var. lacrymans S7.9]|uniref:SNF2 family DNA-dependent ATPase n=1 Tax=Serpula lacrymans var. lacrymans (strain S7.9) TaxID=578457 RepID=F8NFH2_SERL9|nr:uncharacterized protein SERLADRAFT_444458 [Serpula lacrymans var. lacrymans S7.9]EGO30851.1 hypothetical protein SERLADRAFT_444458 [Serpula lacrymans var. lacrymans S7.9]
MSDDGLSDHLLIFTPEGESPAPADDALEPNGLPVSEETRRPTEDDVAEVIGELQESSGLYWFVRFQDGIAHKFLARAFEVRFKDLAAHYEQKKAEGVLHPFDPSAHYVHPASRLKSGIMIKLPGAVYESESSSGSKTYDTDEATDSEEDVDFSDDEDYEGGGTARPKRMITSHSGGRASRPLRQTKLLISPKKTRSKVQPVYSDSEDGELDGYDEEVADIVPTRRSGRATKRLRDIYRNNYVDSVNESDDDKTSSSTPSKGKQNSARKKTVRGKDSRPAYGHFRVVADIDYDPCSDDDTLPLRIHRDICEKCHEKPAHLQLEIAQRKAVKGCKKSKKWGEDNGDDEDENENEDKEEKINRLGGWVRCLKCPVTAHWRCLAKTQRDDILKAAHARDKAAWKSSHLQRNIDASATTLDDGFRKRTGLSAYEITEFICGSCMKGGICMGCLEVALEPDVSVQPENDLDQKLAHELFYRCFSCKRLAHYQHLPVPEEMLGDGLRRVQLAKYYQINTGWRCGDCASLTFNLDKILAWRPYPLSATEPSHPPYNPPNYKSMLPREYLVKWMERSYKRTQWVPHMWLVSTNWMKLKNFVNGGAKVVLLKEPICDEKYHSTDVDVADECVPPKETQEVPFEIGADETRNEDMRITVSPLDPVPDAERRIPMAWKTVDRILDVRFWNSGKQKKSFQQEKAGNFRNITQDGDDIQAPEIEIQRLKAYDEGEQPDDDLLDSVDQYLRRLHQAEAKIEDIENVAWAFIKWGDLGYDEATWDSPPRPNESTYAAFKNAFRRYIDSRNVYVNKLTPSQAKTFDNRPKGGYKNNHALRGDVQPDLGQSNALKLMPFQVDGVNWLCDNWWNLQHCILADEMGLGKTVQIVTFLGIVMSKFEASPALVVVPNSTITNWVREFERWAPRLRVVPFYGEAKARDVIKQYELYHNGKPRETTGAKYHVLVTTYETLTNNRDFAPVFRTIPRWEILVVDEGQRLKSDSSLLFKKLKELNTIHRIIMTGTPLNNNMRELFNLMNFLDPQDWNDLERLEKEYQELNEDLIKQLHNRLRSYFLRRIKSEVLQLPPKNEVIVPVSMAPLQKELYRSILSQNLSILNSFAQPSKSKVSTTTTKTNINNILMQLRKCLQHPYLVNEDIEPRGLPPQETHEKLIDASGKLRLLRTLLPKLKARGHRVLLFSQFVIALDIVEDYLQGEGFKFLRLDGNTKQVDRQKGMDEFNRPNSDVFIYLLTTRAGGVGINLWSADTVIIFDPDFNPHQDLQAIARSHRYGQQKTCLVFRLMVKDSAEDRIMQTGKKKLVLDHLIVQKMDDDDSAGDDVQSILTFGAKALFEEDNQSSRDIVYSDIDIEKLIEKTEKEGDQTDQAKNAGLFSFAKVWAAEKDSLEELDDAPENDQRDSWAQTLQRVAAERDVAQAKEATGRGVRRRVAAVVHKQQTFDFDFDDTPGKTKKRKSKSVTSGESDAYPGSPMQTDKDSSVSSHLSIGDEGIIQNVMATEDQMLQPKAQRPQPLDLNGPDSSSVTARYRPSNTYVSVSSAPQAPTNSNMKEYDIESCGLCGLAHGSGSCLMTERSENLAEYRAILLKHGGDEPPEERASAIRLIDETLSKRGHIHLIFGQPLHLLEERPSKEDKSKKASSPMPSVPKPKSRPHPRPLDMQRHYQVLDMSDKGKARKVEKSKSRPVKGKTKHDASASTRTFPLKRAPSPSLAAEGSSKKIRQTTTWF